MLADAVRADLWHDQLHNRYDERRVHAVVQCRLHQRRRHGAHVPGHGHLGWLARQPIEVPAKPPAPPNDPRRLTVAQAEALLRACPDLETQRWVALSLFAGLRPGEVEALRWEKVQEAIAVADAKTHGLRHAPVNLRAWLKVPKPARGPVVSQAAGRKVKALLLKLNIPVAALRTTCVLCWLALQGGNQTARQAGVTQMCEPGALPAVVSRAEAEGFFGLTPD